MMLRPPERVRAVLEAIREAHPYTLTGRIARSERSNRDSEALWERMRKLPDAQLGPAIESLRDHEVSLLAYGALPRIGDSECLTIFERLCALRRSKQGSKAAWAALLVTNGSAAFRELARVYVERQRTAEKWSVLLQSERPLDVMADLYFRSDQRLERWMNRDDVRLADFRPVKRAIIRALLSPRTVVAVIAREGIETFDEWLELLFVDSERIAWFRTYLVETDSTRWKVTDPILRRIERRFGPPSRQHEFWATVSDGTRIDFENWLKNVELTALLQEGERVTFWRIFLSSITRSIASRDRKAIFICFEKWFAVQFIDAGRATYMFETRYLSAMRRLDASSLYRRVLDHSQKRLGRYEQRGSRWQWYAEAEVRQLINRYA
jgi:hypothetical protein